MPREHAERVKTHNEGVEENRNDKIEGGLHHTENRGGVGKVEVTTNGDLAVLERVNYPDGINEYVLSKWQRTAPSAKLPGN